MCYQAWMTILILLIGASLSEPQYSQEWYVRQVHKNLLNKNGLPYTAAELYASPVRESVLKEYDLPHTIAVCTLQT